MRLPSPAPVSLACPPPSRALGVAFVLAACAVLGAGAGGVALLSAHRPVPGVRPGPMLLAPMVGVIDTCILADRGSKPTAATLPADLQARCSGSEGSAAALVESTLQDLEPAASPSGQGAPWPLGYTLPVPLLQLFERDAAGTGWRIDQEAVDRVARTVQGTARPLVLYLFSTHFETGAALEKELAADPANLAQTRDGPLPMGSYYGAPVYPWSLASTETPVTRRRVQATQAVLDAVCQLPADAVAKIRGVTLLGELHQLFPDFEAGMGFAQPYRVSDYSAASVAGFQRSLARQFGHIARLNQALGSDYAGFGEVLPPARDIRTEPLQRFTEHIDSFAHGSLPIAGWAHAPQATAAAPAWVHVYRNGVYIGKTPVSQGRQDVLMARPELGDANTGWRLDLDFRRLPPGLHRIDLFLQAQPGPLTHLGTRQIALMDRQQRTPALQPQRPLPPSTPAGAGLAAHIDLPADQSSYYYNPLVPLWHAFRAQQVVDYLQFFDAVVQRSCLADTPRYTHQIVPFANPGWDANKFAIEASLQPHGALRLGVSLYGNAAYGKAFSQWLARSGHRTYGVTEFHPLKALDAPELEEVLARHAAQGAAFVSFFLEPRWQGRRVARGHNLFSFDPQNPRFGSDQLYQATRHGLQPRPAPPPTAAAQRQRPLAPVARPSGEGFGPRQ